MLPILHQSYWRDEVFSVLLASRSLKEVFFLTIKDVHPPLYYFLLHFWIKLFGDLEYVTRSLSLFCHFLLVISCFFLIRHLLKSWKPALLGALAILFNPFLIEYAFETRAYLLFALLVIVAVFLYFKKRRFLSSFFWSFVLLTHNFGVFFWGSFLSFWIYKNKKQLKQKIKEASLLFALPILVFLGWLRFLWDQWVEIAGGFWIEPKTSSIFVDTFRAFFQGSRDYPSKGMFYNLALALVFIAFSYFVVRSVRKKSSDKRPELPLVFLFSIPFLIVYVISTFWVPIFHERLLIPVLPLFIVWVTYSLYRLSDLTNSLSYVILALAVAYVLFGVQSTEEIMREATKPAVNYGVEQTLLKAQDGDVLIPESILNFLEVKYYVGKSGRDVSVYAHSSSKEIPFYLGSVLFDKGEIITDYPQGKRVWVVKPDGGYYLYSY